LTEAGRTLLRTFGNLSGVHPARITRHLPSWKNTLLAVLAAGLLILAFPDFEFWFLAWFALVPLLWAIERQANSSPPVLGGVAAASADGVVACFLLGWIFGNIFFFATCWWLTFAPITYGGFPVPLAYFLLFCVTSVAAIFPGLFGVLLAILLRRFGSGALLLAPFVWIFTEFLRYWITGNNWNSIGYSQAFGGLGLKWSCIGGVHLVSLIVVLVQSSLLFFVARLMTSPSSRDLEQTGKMVAIQSLRPFLFWQLALDRGAGRAASDGDLVSQRAALYFILVPVFAVLLFYLIPFVFQGTFNQVTNSNIDGANSLIAVQPDVPMAGLTKPKWDEYRRNHVRLAEAALATIDRQRIPDTTVIFPESPMNFMYEDDAETREFINGFAGKNNVSLLFNSAEPDAPNNKFYNSAVMVGPDGKEVAQYDKIYLLPFGEAVPFPLDGIMPGFVGSFSYGREYDLLPIGPTDGAKAGVMICFESHFGQLSREYVRNGADVIIEMTNDGYLGPTPVLRQHLANAVFRAVETNRPVLRVTNVGITAYINERGAVLDAAEPYTEATRVWSVARSDGSQTFYVKYGDWFAWLCSIVTIGFLIFGILKRKSEPPAVAGG
jgi:apolipoprotein N-acyltransferase